MAIVRVQIAAGSGAGVSSLNVLLSSLAVTAGNALILHGTIGFDPTQSTLVPTDNVNAGAWSTAIYSTTWDNVSTQHGSAGIFYRLNLSSGAIASTYRVRFDAFGASDEAAMTVYEYSGIASFDKVNSTRGTSSSPAGASQTAASASVLFSAVAMPGNASTQTFRSTGASITVVSLLLNGAGKAHASGELITSSLTAQPTFRLANSTTWFAQTALFLASTGGGAAVRQAWAGGLLGVM